ncbi:MAG: 3'-5' exonuclease [Lachnospiraceae bacterium]|nr:3'-5' exonuclease [Lachnospiraceae bacterium]
MVNSYVCVDIETTGVRANQDKIIEIGALKIIDGKVVDTFQELINPERSISPFITGLTGIDDEMVRGCDTIEVVLPKFVEFAKDYPLLGHNLSFDYGFLKQNADNLKIEFEKEGVDTLKISRKVHKSLASKSLANMCEYYGIVDENHHRAFNDASITSMLYQKLQEEFGQEHKTLFESTKLKYREKKIEPITEKQKKYLMDLYRHHRMEMDFDIDLLSRGEASIKIDKILKEKGIKFY